MCGIKGSDILQRLAGADEYDGYIQFLLDRQRYAAAGGSIQLGKKNARAADRFGKRPCLRKSVKPCGGVQSQKHFLRGIPVQPVNDAVYLLQLFHQVGPSVQPPRRVYDENVRPSRLAGLVGIVGHRPRVRPGLVADNVYAHPVAKDFKLLLGGGPEGIGGAQHHLFPFLRQVVRQFGNTGRLADSVHSHHQDNVWGAGGGLTGPGAGRAARFQVMGQHLLQESKGGIRVRNPLASYLLLEILDNSQGSLDPDVGGNQYFLKLFPNRLIQARGPENIQYAPEPALPAPFDPFVGFLLVAFPISLEE